MAERKLAPQTHVPHTTTSGTFARAPLRSVLMHPHPILSMRSIEIDPCAPANVALAHAMVATMRVAPACVGLAAPQIGEPVRLFVMDVTGHKKTRSCAGLVVLANPRIVARGGNVLMREGCMSVPHWTGDVARASEVTVEGFDPDTGKLIRFDADGMEARCLQHEIDHLDGYLFVDRLLDPSSELFARKQYV